MEVKAWKEIVTIPTYEIGEPEKNPIFLEKRIYQGSSGSVYPHPIVEKISDEKIDKEWTAIYLENKYLKIMILPELGGRVQMAYDKMKERHFVYYNQVIKPALVGLTGPWISGGIEFNWPQHHRPSTYSPVDFDIEENADGSKTVWCSEVERMFRTKGMAGFTLHPNKAYLEIKVKLYNRTAQPQTFLWWANPAVKVNDHYQSVFPPDVNAVFDHGKRDVSEFPIAKGEYYKVDYSPGTDISKYKNIPVPTSYMAIQSDYDFVGGYENDSKGGMLHVANHHVSPGKKQWTWGNGEFGKAWDRNLTDENGPYIELMCGVYTDNQPDFSWIMPYEEKSFSQYFMPYRDLGVVKNATKEAMLNIELENGKAVLKAFATSEYPGSLIRVEKEGQVLMEDKFDFHPGVSYDKQFDIDNPISLYELRVVISDHKGKVLVNWQAQKPETKPIPEPAKAAKEPSEIKSIEQLYLTGQHLEQYRHATFDPAVYYKEALTREPGDIRSNNAMGLWNLKKGKFSEALVFFDTAITTLTERNPNPYDSEVYYNKGVVLSYLERKNEAYDSFSKSCWNAAWQDSGYFRLAQIDCAKRDYQKALELVDRSLMKNWHNHKARHLKIILLKKLGQIERANNLIDDSLALDRFNFGALYEKYLQSNNPADLENFKFLIRDDKHNYIEYSLDYAEAGQYDESIALLSIHTDNKKEVYPMIHYFLGWYQQQNGNFDLAKDHYSLGGKMPKDYCFPNRLEEMLALQAALTLNSSDSNCHYYLGNFWYASKQYKEAQYHWESSLALNGTNPICHRNLALLYYNKTGQKHLSKEHLEKAFSLDQDNARVLLELDQLYKKQNSVIDERLQLLENNLKLTNLRDDLYLEKVSMHNIKGQYDKALNLINNRHFHPWEGGEGKVPYQYLAAHIGIAEEQIRSKDFNEAIRHLETAQVYPHNLGEGKLFGAQENDIFYLLGCAYEGLGTKTKAADYWEKASNGSNEPSPAIFYNDQQPDKIFYQGLALLKIGQKKEAHQRFNKLVSFGETHINDKVKIDYFAVSLPDLLIWEEDLDIRNTINCLYLIGLGNLGLGKKDKAIGLFERIVELDKYHFSANKLLKSIEAYVF